MTYYDIELIDTDPTVDNFKFNKVSEEDVTKIKDCFEKLNGNFQFNAAEGEIFLERKYFRGIMSMAHQAPKRTVYQETMEEAKEVETVSIANNKNKKKVFKEGN